jgi:hypothetical protein
MAIGVRLSSPGVPAVRPEAAVTGGHDPSPGMSLLALGHDLDFLSFRP